MWRHSVLPSLLFGSAAAEKLELGNVFGLGMPGGHNMSMDGPSAEALGGSTMERVYTKYAKLPVGAQELDSAGWKRHNTVCDPFLGYAWTQASSGPTKSEPLILYTTEDGKPAGVGTMIRNFMPKAQQKWTTQAPLAELPTGAYQIDVAFRRSDVCTQGAGHDGLGDVLIVNPGGSHSQEVPLERQAPWKTGSCYDGMGFHGFLNTNPNSGPMPWDSSDLFPVVAMYHEGKINAIFFASVTGQVTWPVVRANWWEPISLSNEQFCGNLCDGSCGFSDNEGGDWGTMHIYFNDHNKVKCPADLTCASEGDLLRPGRRSCCPTQRGEADQLERHEQPQKSGTTRNVQMVMIVSSSLGGVLAAALLGTLVVRKLQGRRLRAPTELDVRESELTI